MATKKNPGLGARQGSIAAALTASSATQAATAETVDGKPKRRTAQPDDVPLSIRLPKPMHEELRRLAYEDRGHIHPMILEGVRQYLQSRGITVASE